jgi:hypothetical protein
LWSSDQCRWLYRWLVACQSPKTKMILFWFSVFSRAL